MQTPSIRRLFNSCRHDMTIKVLAVLGVMTLAACRSADPRQELEIVSSETYWVIDSKVGTTTYIAPAVRLEVRNKGTQAHHNVVATASFRRVGDEDTTWGSAWARLTPFGKNLEPGQTVTIVLVSDGRYNSQGSPESMFTHALFKDALAHVYLRIGNSDWVKVLELPIDRRIGSHSIETYLKASPPDLPTPPEKKQD